LGHDGFLHEITEGRMRSKPTMGRRIQMLQDLANVDWCVHSNGQQRMEKDGDKGCQKLLSIAEDY